MIVFIGWSMQPYSLKGGKVVKDDNFQQVKIFFFLVFTIDIGGNS